MLLAHSFFKKATYTVSDADSCEVALRESFGRIRVDARIHLGSTIFLVVSKRKLGRHLQFQANLGVVYFGFLMEATTPLTFRVWNF